MRYNSLCGETWLILWISWFTRLIPSRAGVGIPGASPVKYPALQQNTGMVISCMVAMGRQQDASACDASTPSAAIRAPALADVSGVSSGKDWESREVQGLKHLVSVLSVLSQSRPPCHSSASSFWQLSWAVMWEYYWDTNQWTERTDMGKTVFVWPICCSVQIHNLKIVQNIVFKLWCKHFHGAIQEPSWWKPKQRWNRYTEEGSLTWNYGQWIESDEIIFKDGTKS